MSFTAAHRGRAGVAWIALIGTLTACSTRRARACSSAAAIAAGSSGSARNAASPHASSSEGCADATTGVPHAIASTTGMPNPSKRDG